MHGPTAGRPALLLQEMVDVYLPRWTCQWPGLAMLLLTQLLSFLGRGYAQGPGV